MYPLVQHVGCALTVLALGEAYIGGVAGSELGRQQFEQVAWTALGNERVVLGIADHVGKVFDLQPEVVVKRPVPSPPL